MPKVSKMILNQNKVGGLTFPSFNTYYKAIAIKNCVTEMTSIKMQRYIYQDE